MKQRYVVLALLLAGTSAAQAQVDSTTIEYQSGSGSNGYDSASFTARYSLHACGSRLMIVTEFVRRSYQWSGTYWLDGQSYPTPGGLDPTVNDQGTFNGRVRTRGGGHIGSFTTIAGNVSGHNCIGATDKVADLAGRVDTKNAAAVEAFLASLEVIPDVNPAYRNPNIENAIRYRLEKEKREEEKKKADEENKKIADAAAAKKAAEEAATKDEENAKKAEEDARNASGDNGSDGGSSDSGSHGGIVMSGGDDSSGDGSSGDGSSGDGSSDGSGDGSGSSGDGSSSSSSGGGGGGNGGTGAVGAAGGLGAVLAGAAGSSGGSDTEDNDPVAGGPGMGMPLGVTLESALAGGLFYMAFAYGLNRHIDERLERLAKTRIAALEPACASGTTEACAEKQVWTTRMDPVARAKPEWTVPALMGPAFAFSLSAGFVHEHHGGMASSDLPIPVDGGMNGMAIDMAFRMKLLRFDVSYHHMRGNLFGEMPQYEFTPRQGFDAIGVGLAIQGGWHHLISPYLGMRFRDDMRNGDFIDNFGATSSSGQYTYNRKLDSLEGGRTLGTLGLTLHFPASQDHTMFKAFELNFELFRSLDGTNVDSGFLATFGRGTWLPSSIADLDGLGVGGWKRADQETHGTWVTPYAFWGGGGFRFFSAETGRVAVSAVDFWLKPGDTGFDNAGVTAGAVGPIWDLPNGPHAITLRAGVGISKWTTSEDAGMTAPVPFSDETHWLGNVKVYGFGTVTAAYRRNVRNHVVEAGLKMPIVWFTNRASNTLGFADARFFDGFPPGQLFVGFGY